MRTVTGDAGADTFTGDDAVDIVNGLGGGDRLSGDANNDTLNGGAGNDVLEGGADTDILNGGANNDFLFGDDGNDTIDGGAGADILDGGEGDDTLDGGGGIDALNGSGGNDWYYVDNAGDVVHEFANGGADRVLVSVSHTLATGQEIDQAQHEVLPIEVWTQDNVPTPIEEFQGPAGYQDQFKALWGMGGATTSTPATSAA